MEMPKAINIQAPIGNSKDNDLSKQVKNIVQSSGKTLWSYSRLSKFHSCKYEYYLQYIAKNRNGRNNVYAVLGDIVHQCLEGFIKGEYNREQMLQKFETIYSSTKIPTLNQTVLLQFPSEKIEKTYIECIRIFLKNYIPAKADKILLEEFLWHLFGGNQKIAVQGYADCILCFNEDNTVIIDDFKTSTKFNKDDLLEKGRQLVMYAYMYQKRTGISVKMVRWLMLKYWEVSFPTVLKQLKDKSVKELKEFLSNNNINEKLKKEEMINKCLHLDLSEFINIHDVNKIVYQKNELSLKVSKEFVKLLEAYGIDKDTINRNLSILQNENSFMMLEPVVQEILNKFKNENIDILIGTQMVVKGHHFPNVTLVGVIAADSSLNIDDYRANERTFQILTQVAGRAGREKLSGKVIIQTYNPDNFSIICAQKQNYEMFYETEIALRKQLKYPPFCDIILISFNGLNEYNIKNISNEIYKKLSEKLNQEEFKIFRPMPSPIDKIQNRYRWRIIIKGNMTVEANKILNQTLKEIYSKNIKDIRISIDVNPNNMS